MIDDILNEEWLTVDDGLEELDVSILSDTHPFELMNRHKDYQPGERHILFVYGTMRRGYTNNSRIMSRPENRYLGFSVTDDHCYIMGSRTSANGIVVPMVRRNYTEGHDIYGELYDIDGPTLLSIDLAEGTPSVYVRKNATVILDGGSVRANIYLFASQFDYVQEYNGVVTYKDENGYNTPTQEFMNFKEYER